MHNLVVAIVCTIISIANYIIAHVKVVSRVMLLYLTRSGESDEICDCVCINHPFSAKVEFSAGAKVVDTLPLYTYISNSENLNNFTVESLNKKLITPAYSVYKSLFNGVLISEFIKCAIWLVYAIYGHNFKFLLF